MLLRTFLDFSKNDQRENIIINFRVLCQYYFLVYENFFLFPDISFLTLNYTILYTFKKGDKENSTKWISE